MDRSRALFSVLPATALLGAGLLVSAGCGEATGVSLPDISMRDIDGNVVSLSELKGKAVLLNFWFLG